MTSARSQTPPPQHSAPFPSPTASSKQASSDSYFAQRSLTAPHFPTTQSRQAPTSYPYKPQPQLSQQQSQCTQQHSMSTGDRGVTGPAEDRGTQRNGPSARDFCLLAEAAKKAQVDCMVRDMGECGL